METRRRRLTTHTCSAGRGAGAARVVGRGRRHNWGSWESYVNVRCIRCLSVSVGVWTPRRVAWFAYANRRPSSTAYGVHQRRTYTLGAHPLYARGLPVHLVSAATRMSPLCAPRAGSAAQQRWAIYARHRGGETGQMANSQLPRCALALQHRVLHCAHAPQRPHSSGQRSTSTMTMLHGPASGRALAVLPALSKVPY